jgi:L-seryl-tRNA(Ser) seleniumtransferase
MEDLGSGSLVDLTRFGLQKEPTVGEVVRAGVDVVTFSGDKLLGGPQAGLILGKRDIIGRIKKNPLNRALRIDKFTLAGLEAILRLYFDEEKALTVIPTLALMGLPAAVIERRAVRLIRRIRKSLAECCGMTTVPVASRVGGGAMPEQDLPSRAVALRPVAMKVTDLERKLRETSMPVIGRIENEALLLDMRTVADDEIPLLAAALFEVFEVEEK